MKKLFKNNSGDTLVEVLLATVVLSIVLAGAYTLSNRASSINQASHDRSRAAAIAQQQAELVRAARDSYDITAGSGQLWDQLKTRAQVGAIPNLGVHCDDFSTLASNRNREFHIDNSLNPQDSILVQDSIFRVWVEFEQGPGQEYWDAHVFVCWPGVGREEGQKLKLVLRLEENNA